MDGLDPIAYPEIDCLCRLSKNITIRCDACGMSNRPGEPAHLCCCAFGWYCSDACCPVCNGSLTYTLAEFRQIVVNRENGGLPPPVPKKPKVQRMTKAESVRVRWSDPEYRARITEACRARMQERWRDPESRARMLAVAASRRKA